MLTYLPSVYQVHVSVFVTSPHVYFVLKSIYFEIFFHVALCSTIYACINVIFLSLVWFEPSHKKTNNLSFRPGRYKPACTVTEEG